MLGKFREESSYENYHGRTTTTTEGTSSTGAPESVDHEDPLPSDGATVADQLENLEQSLDTLLTAVHSRKNQLFSEKDAATLQETFRESKNNFLFEQARLHEGPGHMAAQNAALFLKEAEGMRVKADGGRSLHRHTTTRIAAMAHRWVDRELLLVACPIGVDCPASLPSIV